jgi:hypothetical protein
VHILARIYCAYIPHIVGIYSHIFTHKLWLLTLLALIANPLWKGLNN